jgi:hypothetical protein
MLIWFIARQSSLFSIISGYEVKVTLFDWIEATCVGGPRTIYLLQLELSTSLHLLRNFALLWARDHSSTQATHSRCRFPVLLVYLIKVSSR